MAIDTSLFYADLPAGTYTAGDVIQLEIKEGPATVRSGRGTAILKRITAGLITDAGTAYINGYVSIQNSDWVDPATLRLCGLNNTTAFDRHSGAVRIGNNTPLTPNSSWYITMTVLSTVTTTTDNSVLVAIDIDYPSVSNVADPDALVGLPASVTYEMPLDITAAGAVAGATWVTRNVDLLKAGYEYCLQEITACTTDYTSAVYLVAICNAAGMGGLQRIIFAAGNPVSIRTTVEYASKLVKGPMDLKLMAFAASGVTGKTGAVLCDFVKRRIA